MGSSEGRIVYKSNGSTWFTETQVKDHLGSVRAVCSLNSTTRSRITRQVDAYYPFGMNIKELSQTSDAYLANEYMYNGKMYQDEMGLGLLDYGARFYDGVLGRWHVPDPLSDLNRRFSPYCYAINNPIRFIDPDGMDTTFADKKAEADFQKAQTTTNERIDEISKKLDDPDISKRERNRLNSEKEELEKVKADFDYICDPNTPEITYSSDASKIDKGKEGNTERKSDPVTGELISAEVNILSGILNAYAHENRHTRQNVKSMDNEARDNEAYTYESYYSPEAVQNKIEYQYDDKYLGVEAGVRPLISTFGIPQMVKYMIDKENKDKKVK